LADDSGAWLGFADWTGGRHLPTIGTNAGAETLPFQSWRRFKEAFAPEIIERAVAETSGVVSQIVDPFGGSGTTALAAQFLGARPTTIEVNPFLADLIEAKIGPIDVDRASAELRKLLEILPEFEIPNPRFPGAPPTFIEPGREGKYIFSSAMASRIAAYRDAIAQTKNAEIKRLFRVVLGSALIPVSNVTVSGKGRRYRSDWTRRQSSPRALDKLFLEGVVAALYDLRRFEARRCREYTLLRGDSRVLCKGIPHDLAVFSPPYPNSFDYTDVYNVELWGVGYLSDRAENTRLREATLRSHVQIYRDMSYQGVNSETLERTIDALRQVRKGLWNPHIPEMIGAYFGDMALILLGLAEGARGGARVYMVVGDSRYANIDVPVAEILAQMAPAIGYDVKSLEACRSMRSSPQQGGRAELAETLVILERR